jgi:AcrR family transcriptional regulator
MVAAASELLFAPQPPTVPSLRAVARKCGVSPTAVYLHFSSQEQLIQAVVEDLNGRFAAHLADADDLTLPVTERLERRAVAYVEWGFANAGAYQLLFESKDRLDLPPHDRNQGPAWEIIVHTADLLAELAAKDTLLWATRLWVALHGLVSLRIHKTDHDWPDEAIPAAYDIVHLHVAAVSRPQTEPMRG